MSKAMFSVHPGGTSNCAIAGGRSRIHTTFSDGVEMVEEYTADGRPQLLVRRWKAPTALGGDGKWEFEVGEPTLDTVVEKDIGIVPSGTNPIFLCRESTATWEWRVRNLPYPKDTYVITIDQATQEIIIRTTNKKYFKRFRVPAMVRASLPLQQSSLSHTHSNNTLVVQYEKPDEVVEAEKNLLDERLSESKRAGDSQCRQQ
ncbi:hypothetical protein H310_13815 [Aphanomyces invadans]|uniref:Protein DPCD n=1 Tax=Aphanomyces invadans TaxID=157072 RepID=A0A024TDT6_9STRA|nr:hypothetical protein H310_13815 [Aphanomyces invadans]ETV91756.1 hypothetical protein H310_13815 [Aphanomyces invadans]|eukprot:XP_008879682.1 hypothetical protein H310_13815 [Aphanomyces invadans]